MEWVLPMRQKALAPFIRVCSGLQDLFPPLDFHCHGGSKARLPVVREAGQTALCLVLGTTVKQKSPDELHRVA